MNDPTFPRLLTKAHLCNQFAFSPRTLENMVKTGDFPPPVRIGKHVYWSEKAVSTWQQRLFSAQENWETTFRNS
ncbi:helix-turn-helix transcriptional regulator [Acidithiobacillus thiooxidans]|jgi:predicted DNA-binding transcriptional regulator AlpA|uniref:Helix-turn-helix domain-containing protein n=1 Tax=Acidithiobacillus thiooxidans TaxID=930 RepID=A0A1C2IIP5_ACITH|nr:helix-turn-helix domain-containing protein [Acidithiobacillus thiooxidans]OCX75850.1 hypothetical protein A6M23_01045 [Acidithiobacillus thiooxidans]OCX83961.1 hypothetical protein A6P08_09610 [Acidithiobacillus thiooxidans]